MVEIERKTVKLSSIRLNPDNPRRISDKDMARLVKSLQDFPEMLNLREIVVDESMTVLGGNMRLLALKKIGAKEVTAKIVKGLTPAQKREFVVKDNASFGQWDFDVLANEWGDLPLVDWGIDLPEGWLDGDTKPLPAPEFEEKEGTTTIKVFAPLSQRPAIMSDLKEINGKYPDMVIL